MRLGTCRQSNGNPNDWNHSDSRLTPGERRGTDRVSEGGCGVQTGGVERDAADAPILTAALDRFKREPVWDDTNGNPSGHGLTREARILSETGTLNTIQRGSDLVK